MVGGVVKELQKQTEAFLTKLVRAGDQSTVEVKPKIPFTPSIEANPALSRDTMTPEMRERVAALKLTKAAEKDAVTERTDRSSA